MEVTQSFLEELKISCGANNCARVMVSDIIWIRTAPEL